MELLDKKMEHMDKQMELLQFTLAQIIANSLKREQNNQPSQTTSNSQSLEETFNEREIPPNLREVILS